MLSGDAIHCACVDLYIMPELFARSVETKEGRTKHPGGFKCPARREAMHMRSPQIDSGKTPATWRPAVCQTDPPISIFTGYEDFAEARSGSMAYAQSKRTYTAGRDGCPSLPARYYDMETAVCQTDQQKRPTGSFM